MSEDLVSVGEIAARLERPKNTIVIWAERHWDFPSPVDYVYGRRVWSWSDIQAWMVKTGRDKLPPYSPPPEPEPYAGRMLPEPLEGYEPVPVDETAVIDWQGASVVPEATESVSDVPRSTTPRVNESGWERELRRAREAEGLA